MYIRNFKKVNFPTFFQQPFQDRLTFRIFHFPPPQKKTLKKLLRETLKNPP